MNILLLSYNNYYNRIYRKHNTVQEYIVAGAQGGGYVVVTDYNFDPADGVYTTAVFGKGTGSFLN